MACSTGIEPYVLLERASGGCKVRWPMYGKREKNVIHDGVLPTGKERGSSRAHEHPLIFPTFSQPRNITTDGHLIATFRTESAESPEVESARNFIKWHVLQRARAEGPCAFCTREVSLTEGLPW